MNNTAFYLSIEATLSLLILTTAIALMPPSQPLNLDELYLLQKKHDLLKIWAKEGCENVDEMISDVMFVFPNKCIFFEIDGNTVAINCKSSDLLKNNKIVENGFCIKSDLTGRQLLKEIKLISFN